VARKRDLRLTPLEAVIMDCVWDLSQATVRQVQEQLNPTRPMAYNTVLTMMGILREKGFLRSRREGRADLYEPTVTREQVGRRSLRELCDRFFAGSARGMVSELLDSQRLSVDEIRAIRREVNRKLREQDGRAGGA
jgi:predicted transcriptional regulator